MPESKKEIVSKEARKKITHEIFDDKKADTVITHSSEATSIVFWEQAQDTSISLELADTPTVGTIETILQDHEFWKLYNKHKLALSEIKTNNIIESIRQSMHEQWAHEKPNELSEKYSQYIDALFVSTLVDDDSYIQHTDKKEDSKHIFTSKKEKVNVLIEYIGLPYIKYFTTKGEYHNHIDILCGHILNMKTWEKKEAYRENFREKLLYLTSFFTSWTEVFHKLLHDNHITKDHLEILWSHLTSLELERANAIFFGNYKGEGWYLGWHSVAPIEYMKALGTDALLTLDPKIILKGFKTLSLDLIPLVIPTKFDGFTWDKISLLSLIPKNDLENLVEVFLNQTENKRTFFELTNEYINNTYINSKILTERQLYHIKDQYNRKNPIDIHDRNCLELLHNICKINSTTYLDILKSPKDRDILKLLWYSNFKKLLSEEGWEMILYNRELIFNYAALKVVDTLDAEQIEQLGWAQKMRSTKLAIQVFKTYPEKININEAANIHNTESLKKLKLFSLWQLHALKSSNLIKLTEHSLYAVKKLSPETIEKARENICTYNRKEIENQIFFDIDMNQ
jgi:hypothetical protein